MFSKPRKRKTSAAILLTIKLFVFLAFFFNVSFGIGNSHENRLDFIKKNIESDSTYNLFRIVDELSNYEESSLASELLLLLVEKTTKKTTPIGTRQLIAAFSKKNQILVPKIIEKISNKSISIYEKEFLLSILTQFEKDERIVKFL